MRYQPIENHGIVGNMHTAALVSLDGSVDWLCLPRFDSPSVFGAILDADKGGRFRIAPAAGGELRHKQYYWPETNVLVTRFLHPDGIAEVEDYMPVGPGAGPDRHVVLDLGDAVGVQEAGDQDVGFRPVVLLVAQLAARGRGDPEAPALVGVEDGPEHAGRVEARQAEPIDRPVQADQGGAVHVADDAVVLDRLVAHRLRLPLPAANRGAAIDVQDVPRDKCRWHDAHLLKTMAKRRPNYA